MPRRGEHSPLTRTPEHTAEHFDFAKKWAEIEEEFENLLKQPEDPDIDFSLEFLVCEYIAQESLTRGIILLEKFIASGKYTSEIPLLLEDILLSGDSIISSLQWEVLQKIRTYLTHVEGGIIPGEDLAKKAFEDQKMRMGEYLTDEMKMNYSELAEENDLCSGINSESVFSHRAGLHVENRIKPLYTNLPELMKKVDTYFDELRRSQPIPDFTKIPRREMAPSGIDPLVGKVETYLASFLADDMSPPVLELEKERVRAYTKQLRERLAELETPPSSEIDPNKLFDFSKFEKTTVQVEARGDSTAVIVLNNPEALEIVSNNTVILDDKNEVKSQKLPPITTRTDDKEFYKFVAGNHEYVGRETGFYRRGEHERGKWHEPRGFVNAAKVFQSGGKETFLHWPSGARWKEVGGTALSHMPAVAYYEGTHAFFKLQLQRTGTDLSDFFPRIFQLRKTEIKGEGDDLAGEWEEVALDEVVIDLSIPGVPHSAFATLDRVVRMIPLKDGVAFAVKTAPESWKIMYNRTGNFDAKTNQEVTINGAVDVLTVQEHNGEPIPIYLTQNRGGPGTGTRLIRGGGGGLNEASFLLLNEEVKYLDTKTFGEIIFPSVFNRHSANALSLDTLQCGVVQEDRFLGNQVKADTAGPLLIERSAECPTGAAVGEYNGKFFVMIPGEPIMKKYAALTQLTAYKNQIYFVASEKIGRPCAIYNKNGEKVSADLPVHDVACVRNFSIKNDFISVVFCEDLVPGTVHVWRRRLGAKADEAHTVDIAQQKVQLEALLAVLENWTERQVIEKYFTQKPLALDQALSRMKAGKQASALRALEYFAKEEPALLRGIVPADPGTNFTEETLHRALNLLYPTLMPAFREMMERQRRRPDRSVRSRVGSPFAYNPEQFVNDADPRERGGDNVVMKTTPPLTEFIPTFLGGTYDPETGKWQAISKLPATEFGDGAVRKTEVTLVVAALELGVSLRLPEFFNGRLDEKSVVSTVGAGKAARKVTLAPEAVSEGHTVTAPHDVTTVSFTLEQSKQKPVVYDPSLREYRKFARAYTAEYGIELQTEISDVPPELWLEIEPQIMRASFMERIKIITEYVQKMGYYDLDNADLKEEKHNLPLGEKLVKMETRMQALVAQAKHPETLHGKKYAGVCADFAALTVALLRRAEVLSGIAVGFNPTGKEEITRKKAHALAFAVLPTMDNRSVRVPVDATPLGVDAAQEFLLQQMRPPAETTQVFAPERRRHVPLSSEDVTELRRSSTARRERAQQARVEWEQKLEPIKITPEEANQLRAFLSLLNYADLRGRAPVSEWKTLIAEEAGRWQQYEGKDALAPVHELAHIFNDIIREKDPDQESLRTALQQAVKVGVISVDLAKKLGAILPKDKSRFSHFIEFIKSKFFSKV